MGPGLRRDGRLGQLHQPRLVDGGLDERGEERVRLERARFQLGVKLHADEPRMLRDLDDLGQEAVGRHAGKPQAGRLQRVAIGVIDLVAVAVAFADPGRAVDLGDPALGVEQRVIGAQSHRAAEILPSEPRSPKPPGTRIACTPSNWRTASPSASKTSESIQSTLTRTLLAMPPCAIASASDL